MAVVALDTHAVVEELQAAGFTEAQAEAVTRTVRKAQDLDLSHLATRADLSELRHSTKGDIDALRQSTRTGIAELKADLLKWMVGAIGLQTVGAIGALIALPRMLPR